MVSLWSEDPRWQTGGMIPFAELEPRDRINVAFILLELSPGSGEGSPGKCIELDVALPVTHLDVDVQLLGDGHQVSAHLLQGADVAGSQGDPDAVHRRSLSLGLLEVLGHGSGGRSRSNSGSLRKERDGLGISYMTPRVWVWRFSGINSKNTPNFSQS